MANDKPSGPRNLGVARYHPLPSLEKNRFHKSKVCKPVGSKSIASAVDWYGFRAGLEKTVQTEEPYREPEDHEAFGQISTFLIDVNSTAIPDSRWEDFKEVVKRVAALYPDLGYH